MTSAVELAWLGESRFSPAADAGLKIHGLDVDDEPRLSHYQDRAATRVALPVIVSVILEQHDGGPVIACLAQQTLRLREVSDRAQALLRLIIMPQISKEAQGL